MKVEIKIDPQIKEPIAVISTPKMTPELTVWVEALEEGIDKSSMLMAKKDDKIFVFEPEQIEIIRTEDGKIKLYNREAHEFDVTKSLHEAHEHLGSNFARISKSTIVNITRIDHLSQSFGGTMHIVMKNGINDYISRKYMSDFKKLFGV